MDLEHVHHILDAAYAEVLDDSRNQPEGLDFASCGPHMKHLAVLATGAAADGQSADQWRTSLLDTAGADTATALAAAERCMRQSGLWPWNP